MGQSVIVMLCSLYATGAAQEKTAEEVQTAPPELRTSSDQEVSYEVKDGDTFWDLAFEFIGDPFQWTNIWEGNPHIKNPHLIFPGDLVMITDQSGDSSSLKVKVHSQRSGQKDSAVASSYVRSLEALSAIQKKFPLSSNFFSSVPFLWTEKDSSGNIYPGDATVNKPVDKESYQLFDIMTLKLGKGAHYKAGDTVDIYSSIRFVRFKNYTANLVKRVGKGRVTTIENKIAHAQLYQMYGVVKGKERAGRSSADTIKDNYKFVEPDTTIHAKVFERTEETASPYLFQTLIIDQGSLRGIKIGDLFAVYHKEKKETSRVAMIGYVGNVTAESSSLVIVSIFENKVSSGDTAVLICSSLFAGD